MEWPAIIKTVIDAPRAAGVMDTPLPATPERVWRAKSGGQSAIALKLG